MAAPALKEWAVVVRALLSGEQLLDVRKGGIREDGRHFAVRATRVWLYPTAEHERPELLKPAYRRWVGDPATPASPKGAVTLPGWADIVGVAKITDPDELARIDGKLIWTCEYAESRLHWKRRDPLWVLAMRVHRLLEPFTIPWRDEYQGCTSWVPVADAPDDPASLPSEPALSDESFTSRMKLVMNDLRRPFEAPQP